MEKRPIQKENPNLFSGTDPNSSWQNSSKNTKQTNDSKKELLLDLLTICHNEASWFPPLSVVLDGLTVEQAMWCDHTDTNSIWQIVNHLVFWNTVWLHRFKENSIGDTDDKNEETFVIQDFSERAWKAALIRLDAIFSEWRDTLADCPESELHERIPFFDEEVFWWMAISNLCTHNVYHIGQIVLIRQKQGSWVKNSW
ncbi:DinB family protein [Paenactinomyces guangxiensis]|uniref:DinB family protein n=1 Tax=Paenactinomyces guangxiensis TaxID=1490290 RepID=A0A7W1WRP9_9BACL|nr:DinB family protein [Paenactinomyces guangxiensis]MBA4494845.1 DinB family protein [Paenactinomyces guangxiensis]MBH8591928.1 DinB family protein [Paenactinomyces guangxiensis]